MKRTVLIYGAIAGAVVSAFMSITMIITASDEKVHTWCFIHDHWLPGHAHRLCLHFCRY
jgi:hypothetical protein